MKSIPDLYVLPRIGVLGGHEHKACECRLGFTSSIAKADIRINHGHQSFPTHAFSTLLLPVLPVPTRLHPHPRPLPLHQKVDISSSKHTSPRSPPTPSPSTVPSPSSGSPAQPSHLLTASTHWEAACLFRSTYGLMIPIRLHPSLGRRLARVNVRARWKAGVVSRRGNASRITMARRRRRSNG